jgi:hypothetical protein
MFDLHTFESLRTAGAVEERNEGPLLAALFAVIIGWSIAGLIAFAWAALRIPTQSDRGFRDKAGQLKKKLMKIGAKVVTHRRHVAFQMADVVIPGSLFADICGW